MANEAYAAWLIGKSTEGQNRVAAFRCKEGPEFIAVFSDWDSAAAFAQTAGQGYLALGYPLQQFVAALHTIKQRGLNHAALDPTPAQYTTNHVQTMPLEGFLQVVEHRLEQSKLAAQAAEQEHEPADD